MKLRADLKGAESRRHTDDKQIPVERQGNNPTRVMASH
jgi:hypothetical protein